MKAQFRQLKLIYAALLIGQLLFFLVILYMVWGKSTGGGMLNLSHNTMLLLVSILFVGANYGARAVGNLFRHKAVAEKQDLNQKLDTYRKSLLVRWFLVEGANLITLILALVEQYQLLFLFFGAGIFVFLSLRPSENAFAQAYELDAKQAHSLH
ncbi:MAG: hypothetical protein R2828_18295 [Saprospiraceae bacterium]